MSQNKPEPGTLYVVATPIGNRQDISERAVAVLQDVDLIAAEDTRHSARLMEFLGVKSRLTSFHDFSSERRLHDLIERLLAGNSLALISDAGTPGISDPGYELVKLARTNGIPVIPVPGPSALVAALSVSGLPGNRFVFEGFLPAKRKARRTALGRLVEEQRTLVFYESPHRIVETLEDMSEILGGQRQLYIGRELTKKFETSYLASLSECLNWVKLDSYQQKGEFVLVLAGDSGATPKSRQLREGMKVLAILADELPLNKAARLAAQISGAPRNALYQAALKDAGEKQSSSD